jgi:hypothetical protein
VDLTQLDLTMWLLIGGAATIVLALLLYCLPLSSIRIPAIVLSSVGGLGVGIAVGIILLASFGYYWKPQTTDAPSPEMSQAMRQAMGGGMPGGGPGGGGRPGGGGGPGGGMGGGGRPGGGGGGPGGGRQGGGGGGGQANPKTTLSNLLVKLDLLTGKPLGLDLSDEQRQTVLGQLKDLSDKGDLKEDEAQTHLDTLLKALEGNKKNLEAVGFRWPGGNQGGRGGQGQGDASRNEDYPKRIKELQERLGKAGTP